MFNKWILPLSCVVLATITLYCGSGRVKDNQQKSSPPEERGKQLAQGVCGSCHLVPSPSDLDKTSWEQYILPRMGYFLGVYEDSTSREDLIEEGPAAALVEADQVYPKERLISEADWKALKAYYLNAAPTKLEQPAQEMIAPDQEVFEAVRPAFGLTPPSTTLLTTDPTQKRVLLGDAFTKSLFVLNDRLQRIGQVTIDEAPVWVSSDEAHYYVTVMGSFSPTDAPVGQLVRLRKDGGGSTEVLVEGLQRPVHHSIGDLDGDGLKDLVICEFAKWTGSLSWWKNLGDGTYERKLLKKEPGSMKAYLRDWDDDGDLDVVALFGQGNEGIFLFANDGEGSFEESALHRFPPSYGSSFMALQDLNNDGLEDIIYCAGDNADFPPILKPYHGIYTFLRKENTLVEDQFLPLNGAYGAAIQDFDGDGDQDLAAISFFPNFTQHPEEGLVYFDRQADGSYTRASFPEVNSGRWIVMHATDIEGDGDQDLLLGSLAFEVPGQEALVQAWVEGGISFILLENKSR